MLLYLLAASILAVVGCDRPEVTDRNPRTISTDPHSKLQGVWVAIAGEFDGEMTEDAVFMSQYTFTFTDNRFVAGSPKSNNDGTFEVETSNQPMHITFNETVKGIFAFKGDELWMCVNQGRGSSRPTTFSAKEGQPYLFTKYIRRPD